MIDRLARAGTELHLVRLIDALDRSLVAPHLCLLDGETEASRALEPADCPIVRLGIRSLHRPRTLRKAFTLTRQFRRWGIDLLQVHFPDSTYFGIPLAKIAGTRRIVSTRRDLFSGVTPVQKALGQPLVRVYHRCLIDSVVVNCEACREAAVTLDGAAPERVAVVENGIDIAAFGGIPSLAAVPARPLRVGAVAMLRPEKQLHLLVQAAHALTRRGADLEFAIAGEGVMRAALQAEIDRCDLGSSFELCGRLADIPAFLASIDVGVLCSDAEGMSNAVVEYMAAGRAVVITDVGAARELIRDGVTGLIVPPGDPVAIADAVARLAADPRLRLALGANARREARGRFSVEAMARTYEAFYWSHFPAPPERAEATVSSSPLDGGAG